MEQFRSTVCKLENDLSRAQKGLKIAKEAVIAEFRHSEAFEMEIADGSATVSEIAFFSLLNRLAHDHFTLDLSSYTLEDVMGVPAPKGATSYPPTPDHLIAYSPEVFLIILEDRTLETTDVEANMEMDAFVKDLNEVLTFDGKAPE